MIKRIFITFLILGLGSEAYNQVTLRDSTVTWLQHTFLLNDDHSMQSYSTASNARQAVHFQARVIENELIRLTLLPDYGGRVISFFYKPTQHEYLYHSECGTPYGMGDGNFYYDWLMVYGGIFPTFPEPEHGKAWLLPWEYEVMVENDDTVRVAMEYTDNQSFAGAPWKFNNGTTGITCRVEISVYQGSSRWDFDVSLLNNKQEKVNYEYWTCTTMCPGSQIDDTGSPLNTELIAPITQYKADWSPGSWIGNYGRLYDFTRINYLEKWNDMGIAYAWDLRENYWGVINHDNEEGIFRISDNNLTPGLKFWTWGKNNVDNNLFDFKNGGADNYIELWAGNSEAFFEDAVLLAGEYISWKETYAPTIGLPGITKINGELAVYLDYDSGNQQVDWQLFDFSPDRELLINASLTGEYGQQYASWSVQSDPLGNQESLTLSSIQPGDYDLQVEIYNHQDDLIMLATKEITVIQTGIEEIQPTEYKLVINQIDDQTLQVIMPHEGHYKATLFNLNGQVIDQKESSQSSINLKVNTSGMAILRISGDVQIYTQKIFIR